MHGLACMEAAWKGQARLGASPGHTSGGLCDDDSKSGQHSPPTDCMCVDHLVDPRSKTTGLHIFHATASMLWNKTPR